MLNFLINYFYQYIDKSNAYDYDDIINETLYNI